MRAFIMAWVATAVLAGTAPGQTTWNGSVDSAWDLSANWSAGIPDAATDATIPAAVPNNPSTAGAASADCLSLTLDTGASLTLDAGVPLSVHANASLSGTLAGTGTLRLEGTGTLSASGTSLIPNLDVDAAAAVITITGDVDITDALSLIDGTLSIGASATLNVGGNATLSGGTLSGTSGGTLDLAADVAFTGTGVSTPPTIQCAGDWSSDTAVTLASGVVVFDGGVTQQVTAAASEFFDVTLGTSTTLDVLLDDIPIAADLSLLSGASFTASSTVRFTGAGQSIDPGGDLPNVKVQGSGSVTLDAATLTIDGLLEHLGGTFEVASGSVVTVTGNAFFSAGTFQGVDATSWVTVEGDITFDGAICTAPPVLFAEANWNSDANFLAASNTVVFSGAPATTQLVDAPSSEFWAVWLIGGSTVNVIAPPLKVAEDLEITPPSTFTESSVVRFIGLDQVVDPVGHLPTVEVGTVDQVIFTDGLLIEGSLTLLYGKLCVDRTVEMTVNDRATFDGGTLSTSDPTSLMTITGDVTWNSTDAVDPPILEVGGNWTGTGFNPNTGRVRFRDTTGADGQLTHIVNSSGEGFFELEIQDGSTLDVVSTKMRVASNLLGPIDGGFTDESLVSFIGTTQTVEPGGPLPRVEVDGTGDVTFIAANQAIVGTLDVIAGAMVLADGTTVSVAGDSRFGGGALEGGLGSELDIEGDVLFAGTVTSSGTPPEVIRCAGDWTSDGIFAPTAGLVTLDGSADTLLSARADGGSPTFFVLRMENGRRLAGNPMDIVADTIRVAPNAEFELNGQRVGVPGTVVDISGKLSIQAGAELALGGGAVMTVASSGTLSTVGSASTAARISGIAGGGYQLVVDGRLESCFFEYADMGQSGFVITQNATLADIPNDMRVGQFTASSLAAPGWSLLDVQRPTDTAFSSLSFEGPPIMFNVTSLAGAQLTMLNYGGTLGGTPFENPGNPLPLGWVQGASTQLTTPFDAEGLEGFVLTQWSTALEVDTEAFLIEQGTTPLGPWTLLGEVTAAGTGSIYTFNHFGTIANVQSCYRLRERLHHTGQINDLGLDCAIPLPDTNPPNIPTVSPGGQLPTINAALALASSGVLGPIVDIRVAAGSYPPFSINASTMAMLQTLRIGSLGNGPVLVDTSAQPIVIQNIGPGKTVMLADIVASGAGLFPSGLGVHVVTCAATIVLDRVDSTTGQPGTPPMSVTASNQVLLQDCDLIGSDGLVITTNSNVVAGKGSAALLSVSGNSRLRTCELAFTDANVEPGSSHEDFAGVMPRADATPAFIPSSGFFQILLDGEPGGIPLLRIDLDLFWFDSGAAKWELISLLPFPAQLELILPPLASTPLPLPFVIPPGFENILPGLSIHLQPVVAMPTGNLRFGHLTRLTFTE